MLPVASLAHSSLVLGSGGIEFRGSHVVTETTSSRAPVHTIAVGNNHALLLRSDGSLVSWGSNDHSKAQVPQNLPQVHEVSVGPDTSAALLSNGDVSFWGSNSFGQQNFPSGIGRARSVVCGSGHTGILLENGTLYLRGKNDVGQAPSTPISGVAQVSLGVGDVADPSLGRFTIFARKDGTLGGFGSNSSGQLDFPQGLPPSKLLCAGGGHVLHLATDGSVTAWGSNGFGQSAVPVGLGPVTQVSAGGYHSLALRADGTVVAWGRNDFGQCAVPVGLSNVTFLAAGTFSSFAIRSNGDLVAWGRNQGFILSIPMLPVFTDEVAANGSFTLARSANGLIAGWGDNAFGQISPPLIADAVQISAGSGHGAALRSNNTVVVWGSNSRGQGAIPVSFTNSGIAQISAGGEFNAVRFLNGRVATWGRGTSGGSALESMLVPPTGLAGVVQIASGGFHVLALLSNGTVTGWGESGTPNDAFQRIPPSGLANVQSISANVYHSMALKADGTVVAWGGNAYSELNVPPGLSDVVSIFAGPYSSYAIKRNTSLVAWGGFSEAQRSFGSAVGLHSVGAGLNHTVRLGRVRAVAEKWLVEEGETAQIRVRIPFVLNRSGTIGLQTSDPRVQMPSSISVGPGDQEILVGALGTSGVIGPISITASFEGWQSTATYIIRRPPYRILRIEFSPQYLRGGAPSAGRVFLNRPAPVGGLQVALHRTAGPIQIPSAITVPAGQDSATFSIPTSQVVMRSDVVISATVDGSTRRDILTVVPDLLYQMEFNPPTVRGGVSSMATINLDSVAPAGGLSIRVWSDSRSGASVDTETVTVAPGASTVTFPVTTRPVNSTTRATIYMRSQGRTNWGVLTIRPPVPVSIRLSPESVIGGESIGYLLQLDGNAPVGGITVQLSTSPTLLTLPSSVTVPEGADSVSGVFSTLPVTAFRQHTVYAEFDGRRRFGVFAINPPTVNSASVSPSSVRGGSVSSFRLTLNGTAPPGGATLLVRSNSLFARFTAPSILIPEGQSVGSTSIETFVPPSATDVTLYGTYGGRTRWAVLRVTP